MKNITKNNNKLINARFVVSGVLAIFGDFRIPFNLATLDIGQDMLDT